MALPDTEAMHRMDLQNKEFDALDKLCECWRRLQLTAVVDDDYPEYRGFYENAMHRFIVAIKNNGRI